MNFPAAISILYQCWIALYYPLRSECASNWDSAVHYLNSGDCVESDCAVQGLDVDVRLVVPKFGQWKTQMRMQHTVHQMYDVL